MSETRPADFFDRLELELRGAAERRPRRWPGWTPAARSVAAVAIAAAVVALALVPALALLGGGSRDQPEPSRFDAPPPGPAPVGSVVRRNGQERTVVATGSAPVAGPWQLESYESASLRDPETGEEYQPAGLPCLGLFLLDAELSHGGSGGGFCGEFPRTPGFSRSQHSAPSAPGAGPVREILVYGWAPEDAAAVRITSGGRVRAEVEPFEGPSWVPGDFYLIAIPADLENGRVNWIDRDGREGSRGIELLPP